MLSIRQIVQATGGKLLQGDPAQIVRQIHIDSRLIKKGDLFIAIKGAKHDAHRFVASVIRQKAGALIVSKNIKAPAGVSVIQVNDTTKALGHVAAAYRAQFPIPVIAITGSAGKTSTKEMIAAVLGVRYKVLKNKKTENNQFGVPLTVFKLKPSHDVLVIELGTNRFGDIPWLAQIVRPHIAVFTNIAPAHLEGLKNIAGVFREKFSMVKYMPSDGVVLFNRDDAMLRKIEKIKIPQRKVTFGINEPSHFRATHIGSEKHRLKFKVNDHPIELGPSAVHSVYNALAAISCGSLFKISYNDMSYPLKRMKPAPGRFELIRVGKTYLIDDTYNANPLSVRSAVETLDALPTAGKKILICADMLELGKQSRVIHEKLGRWIARKNLDHVFTYGNDAQFISKAFKENGSCYFKNRDALHQRLKKTCHPGDTILIKGSRSMQMEKTIDYLKGLLK